MRKWALSPTRETARTRARSIDPYENLMPLPTIPFYSPSQDFFSHLFFFYGGGMHEYGCSSMCAYVGMDLFTPTLLG
jgi:hypothetical protein